MAPIPTPRYLLAAGLPSSARYAATVSVRGLLVAEIQVLVPYRIHPSIHLSLTVARARGGSFPPRASLLRLVSRAARAHPSYRRRSESDHPRGYVPPRPAAR